jgi:hypothetical protein
LEAQVSGLLKLQGGVAAQVSFLQAAWARARARGRDQDLAASLGPLLCQALSNKHRQYDNLGAFAGLEAQGSASPLEVRRPERSCVCVR